MASTLPTQIDYTSRDFASLRDDLIARIRTSIPDWQGNDPADFGVVMAEAFAHLGDVLSYYTDRAANESTLTTATRRGSVISLARDLGYDPSGYTSATGRVVFSNTSASPLTIPAKTVLTASVEKDDFLLYIPFETDSAVTVAAGSAASVTITQGETVSGATGYGESLGLSTGNPSMYMRIPSDQVIKSTVSVFVYDGVNYYPWTQVQHLADYSPTSRVFRVIDDGYGGFFVQFGDGASGQIPSQGHVVYATYRTVDGVNGNVPAGSITEITSVPGLTSSQVAVLVGQLTVTNEAATSGGSDPEDLAAIRNNASLAYRANNRAVTLEDYQSLALQVSGCGKASAQSSVPTSVSVAVAPSRNAGASEARPGYTYNSGTSSWDTTAEMTNLISAVSTYLEDRRLAGVSVSVLPPVYTPISITLTITALSSVLNTDVSTIVKQALVDRLDYANVGFGATVLTTDLIALVSSLGVTQSVTVTVLKKTANADGVTNLVAAEDEIFLLPEANVTLVVTGGAS